MNIASFHWPLSFSLYLHHIIWCASSKKEIGFVLRGLFLLKLYILPLVIFPFFIVSIPQQWFQCRGAGDAVLQACLWALRLYKPEQNCSLNPLLMVALIVCLCLYHQVIKDGYLPCRVALQHHVCVRPYSQPLLSKCFPVTAVRKSLQPRSRESCVPPEASLRRTPCRGRWWNISYHVTIYKC